MSIENLLTAYRKLTEMTENMLTMVQNEQWDTLIALQSEYEQHVQLMTQKQRQQDLSKGIDPEQDEVINSELNKILANHQQLKVLIHQRCMNLSVLISDTVSQRSQISTYHQVASMRS